MLRLFDAAKRELGIIAASYERRSKEQCDRAAPTMATDANQCEEQRDRAAPTKATVANQCEEQCDRAATNKATVANRCEALLVLIFCARNIEFMLPEVLRRCMCATDYRLCPTLCVC